MHTGKGSVEKLLVGCFLAALLGACGDSSQSGSAPDASASGAAGAGAPLLAPPKKGRGVQFTMSTKIEAGEDVERCKFVRTGSEDLIVNHDEVRFTAGSHHALLFTTPYEDIPTEDLDGTPVDTSGVFDCSEGVQGFWKVSGLLAVSQSPEAPATLAFPEGVGVRLPARNVLLINAHYLNVATSKVEPKVFINLHTITEAELSQEGGLLFWYNPFLKVPARGTSMMRASCPVLTDISLINAQSHMHRRGVGYVADLVSPDGVREQIYTNEQWQEVPVKAFTPNLQAGPGSHIEWECQYTNGEDHDVYQGPRTKEEMCMFIGSYYPRDDNTSFCSRAGAAFLGAEWKIGTGTASCADSFSCVLNAASMKTGAATTGTRNQGTTTAITDCLVASDPSVSRPLSDVVGCLASAPMGEELSTCSAEIAACQSP